jgi:trehalose 6-phosphate synthase
LDIHANRQPPALVPAITFWPQKSRRARNLTVLLWLSVGGVGVSVVLVSNRAVSSRANGPVEGGLASALLQAVKHSGATWVGTRVRASDSARAQPLSALEALGAGTIALVDLPSERYRRYYEGFANSALWPVLHSRPDLIRVNEEDYAAYCDINAIMARGLRTFLRPDALIWVHDYHFLTLAQELRRLGVDRPIGFFLHTPFPDRCLFSSLPRHRELVRAMLQYDLIGFQTDTDRSNFAEYVRKELGLTAAAQAFVAETKTRIETFPIGIDTQAFANDAIRATARPDIARLRASLQNAKLVIGVDRIDYSKGLENRFRAFDRLLQTSPELKRQVSLLQIGLPSRGQIATYCRLQTELAAQVSDINGRHGEVDWLPIRYLNKGFAQSTLAGFYRTAQVGLVTPLHDGMNLVAKEYVAAQNPLDPGVLVLSRFAGAAKQLDAAFLVNPNDMADMTQAIRHALAMPLNERRERWEAMMTVLENTDVDAWFADFMASLAKSTRLPQIVPSRETAISPFLSSSTGLAAVKSS